jgi:hypothetical protein
MIFLSVRTLTINPLTGNSLEFECFLLIFMLSGQLIFIIAIFVIVKERVFKISIVVSYTLYHSSIPLYLITLCLNRYHITYNSFNQLQIFRIHHSY